MSINFEKKELDCVMMILKKISENNLTRYEVTNSLIYALTYLIEDKYQLDAILECLVSYQEIRSDLVNLLHNNINEKKE